MGTSLDQDGSSGLISKRVSFEINDLHIRFHKRFHNNMVSTDHDKVVAIAGAKTLLLLILNLGDYC